MRVLFLHDRFPGQFRHLAGALAADPTHDVRFAARVADGEVPGVSNVQFLRESLNAQRKARGQEPLSGGDFLKLAREKAGLLKLDMDMLKRPVNVDRKSTRLNSSH